MNDRSAATDSIVADATAHEAAMRAALDVCAREPIHVPGSIQPHGALLVLRSPDDPTLLQASANAPAMLGLPLVAGEPVASDALHELLAGDSGVQRALQLGTREFQVHRHDGAQGVMLEFEPAIGADGQALESLYPRLQRFLDASALEETVVGVAEHAAAEVRRLTGFHRVMVYRFDEDWHGTVIAEDGEGSLPSYLGLRFPASDIPAQARELYRRNRLRMIPDARYQPVPLVPATSPLDGAPLDLSAIALRSVSPVHLEYMRNMGTAASMSISIVIDGRLWGLVSCHHGAPWRVGPRTRIACDFLGQLLALEIGARTRVEDARRRLETKHVEGQLLARLSRADSVHTGLVQAPDLWLGLVGATGAAVLTESSVVTAGRTPSIDQLVSLAGWLHRQHGQAPIWSTHRLPAAYAAAQGYADVGCGVLAVPISALHPHYVLWFRPEVIHTVHWGGPPDKPLDDDDGPLRPRRSFSMWSEEVRGQAARWTAAEQDAALSFRNSTVDVVLKRAEERAALTERLEASNKELEAFSYSVSHDLRAPFRHIVGFAQLLGETEPQLSERSRHYLDTIVDAALSAGRLVDDLLNFSQLGRASLSHAPVDMNKLVEEVRRSVKIDQGDRQVQWKVLPLPPAWGDASLLRQTLANLLDNALKYTRDRDPAVIEVGGEQRSHETVYWVRDNGVGFDMDYVGKLFGVFQRLHRVEEFEGSGIGLALARRIVDRHGGWISAEGAPDRGATFRFGLPRERNAGK